MQKFHAISSIIGIALLLPLLAGPVTAQEPRPTHEYDYKIDLLSVPSVNAKMQVFYHYPYNEQTAARVVFTNQTTPVFSSVFKVDNIYETIYDPQTCAALFSRKIIQQPNVNQDLSACYENRVVRYSNGFQRTVPAGTHSFFSFLVHLTQLSIAEITDAEFVVDLEGLLYRSSQQHAGEQWLRIGKQKVLTDEIVITFSALDAKTETAVEITDVFHWRIAAGKAKRRVWIERNQPRRIVKAQFFLPPAWVTARMIANED